LVGAGGKGIEEQVPEKASQKAKKPPGEPGGFVWVSGDDAARRNQLHEIIMHKSRGPTTAGPRMLLQNVKPLSSAALPP
jgi:hypothetical protein